MEAITPGLMLVPVTEFEHKFTLAELMDIAYWEFLQLEEALSEIRGHSLSRGDQDAERRAFFGSLWNLHRYRWGERPDSFYARAKMHMPAADESCAPQLPSS